MMLPVRYFWSFLMLAGLLTAVLSVFGGAGAAVSLGQSSGDFDLSEAGRGTARMSEEEMVYTASLARYLVGAYATVAKVRDARTQGLMELELERQVERFSGRAPRGLYRDAKRPSIMYVSIYAPNGAKLTAEGRGGNLQSALLNALAGLMMSEHWEQLKFSDNLRSVRLGFDLVWGLEPYMANLAEPFLYTFVPGVDGLIYENYKSRSVLVPWEAVRQAWSVVYVRQDGQEQVQEERSVYNLEELKQTVFHELLRRNNMTIGTYQTPAARVMRFRTQSFIEAGSGGADGRVLTLFRVGPVVRPEDLSGKMISEAVSASADYLARAPERSGVVRDGYDPLRLAWSSKKGMRPDQQGLCLEALARLHQKSKENWTHQGAKLLLETLMANVQGLKLEGLDKQSRDAVFASYDGRSEASWHAQMLLGVAALQEISPNDPQKNLIRHLANTLLTVQKSDGSFMLYIGPGTDQGLMQEDREDHHGASLSLLALVRAYEILQDDELLHRARLTADYLVKHREKALGREGNEGLADVHLISALSALDRHEVNDGYVRYAMLCVDQLLKLQAADPFRFERDEWGGFGESGSVNTYFSAFCLRGMKAASRMLERIRQASPKRYANLKLQEWQRPLKIASERATAYLLGMQYTAENSFYIDEARIAAGGFRHSVADSRISTVTVATWLLSESEGSLER